ncbi:Tim44/TimA family putative adaptor protein [Roseicyclus sp. F158]|uniref:Tim44/TimA family putative adaptor protein n=1 Tax=Tropicimonas omnivorans TaxID=3075590 RepID=A0ABU3DCP2_9RHOB|nr:Tim44/TimA family putative adaptor protein [Roseicyclus sp. F158]MDT0681473.1 Tim44/TimA family putative adaptor protein [Roseicyclus sp. F158]
MSAAVIQLLVLAGIAIFLIVRLKSVLGTREGYEKPTLPANETPNSRPANRPEFEVIEGGPDRDIVDHVPEDSESAKAIAAMKNAEPSFNVGEFLSGARGAYEMILMAFEQGDLTEVRPFLADDVYQAFADVVAERDAQGLTVDANFVGLREIGIVEATYDRAEEMAEITVRFVGELTSVVKDAAGEVIEGDAQTIRRQRDVWSFARKMGVGDPNWKLVATGE